MFQGAATVCATSALVLALGAVIAWRARTSSSSTTSTTKVPVALKGTNLGFSSTGDPQFWIMNLLLGSMIGQEWPTGQSREVRVTVRSELVTDAGMRGMDLFGEVQVGLNVLTSGRYEVVTLDPVAS
jgi:hypothetical protein